LASKIEALILMPPPAQTAADWNEGLHAATGAQAGDFTLRWWGKNEPTRQPMALAVPTHLGK